MPTYNNTYSGAASFASSLDVSVNFASGTNVAVECLCWVNGNSSGTTTTGVVVDPAGINQSLTAETSRTGPSVGLSAGTLRSFRGIVVSPPSGSVTVRMSCSNADGKPQMWVRLTNDVASFGTAVESNANNRAPSWTVTSATGDLVSAMYVCDGDDSSTITATSPATQRSRQTLAVSGASPSGNYLCGAVLDEAGASSVTIDGDISGGPTPTWAGTARNLVAMAGDTTAPTLTSATGTGGTNAASASVSTDEGNGTLYCVFTASATAPTAAQVKAGNDHTGSAALRAVSQAVSGTGVQNIASGAVTSGTRYVHFMHEDAAANQSTVASSASFTVSAGGGGSSIAAISNYYRTMRSA